MSMDRRSFIKGSAATAAAAVAAAPMAALADEAAVSGPTWLGTEPEVAESEIVKTVDTTLLIVGAGTAGLACAGTAADMGLDFFLAEKISIISESREYLGAVNSKMIVEAGLECDKGMLLNELSRYASGNCNHDLLKMWIDESAEFVDWVTPMFHKAGHALMLPDYGGDEMGGTLYYSPVTEHMNGTVYIPPCRNDLILDHIMASGNEVHFDHNLVKLVHDGGKVTGAIFETDEGYVQVNAKYTALCTGGYSANPEMMMALQPDAIACSTGSSFSPTTKGDGIKAAMWIGAAKQNQPTPMLFDRGAVEPGVNAGYDENGRLRGERFQLSILSQPFLKVNRLGKRFTNESTPYDNLCYAAGLQPGGVSCMVFDADAPADIARFRQGGCAAAARGFFERLGSTVDEYLEYVGDVNVKKADTLEELAEMLGFEGEAAETFLATVEEYNAMYDAGVDTQYGKEAYRLSQIRTAPFYGCWAGASLLCTLDGLCINSDLQVLTADKTPIEGLYAMGDCSGGFFSVNYPEYIVGSAAGRTSVQGRHMALAVAATEGIDVEAKKAEAMEAMLAEVTEVPETPDYTLAAGIVCW